MREINDLRKILSLNIKKARAVLHITQAKLALYSDISVPHMIEIEQCKTWVSDRTLANIAKALNMEVYELLVPGKDEKKRKPGKKDDVIRQMAKHFKSKKSQLQKDIDTAMDDLLMDIIKLNNGNE